jgi:hypothetical protein
MILGRSPELGGGVADAWWYDDGTGQVGPITLQELQETLSTYPTAILNDVEVWREGYSRWVPAHHAFDDLLPTRQSYPQVSRVIDIIALLVLIAAIFAPFARIGFRSMQLAETDSLILFAGCALLGLFGALGRKRWIAVTGALIYGSWFAILIVLYYSQLDKARAELKGNPFWGLFDATVGLDWGCAVILFAVSAVIFSNAIGRNADS